MIINCAVWDFEQFETGFWTVPRRFVENRLADGRRVDPTSLYLLCRRNIASVKWPSVHCFSTERRGTSWTSIRGALWQTEMGQASLVRYITGLDWTVLLHWRCFKQLKERNIFLHFRWLQKAPRERFSHFAMPLKPIYIKKHLFINFIKTYIYKKTFHLTKMMTTERFRWHKMFKMTLFLSQKLLALPSPSPPLYFIKILSLLWAVPMMQSSLLIPKSSTVRLLSLLSV